MQGGDAMDSSQASPFRQMLLAKRSTVLAHRPHAGDGALGHAAIAAARSQQHQDFHAQAITACAPDNTRAGQTAASLEAIDAALQRIATGTYGDCRDCGVPITMGRLRATPEAARCVHCQDKADLRHNA
jgi:DnaK suppressor protein